MAVVALLLSACAGTGPPASPELPRGTLVISSSGDEVRIAVQIARTEEARRRGLMGRTDLARDTGMVFLVDDPTSAGFTMRDTLIPLSLAVWDRRQRILAILDMAPCRAEPCPVYDPGVPWTGAVEVAPGTFDRHGVAVGDAVRLER